MDWPILCNCQPTKIVLSLYNKSFKIKNTMEILMACLMCAGIFDAAPLLLFTDTTSVGGTGTGATSWSSLLILILQVYSGILFFWFFEAIKYIGARFDWKKWKRENLATFIWSLGLALFISLFLFFSPESTSAVFGFMGINVGDFINGDATNLSGVMAGFLIGQVVRRLVKKRKSGGTSDDGGDDTPTDDE